MLALVETSCPVFVFCFFVFYAAAVCVLIIAAVLW